ncbi:hypothetical protein JHK85_045815 [Glycine max]|nr:hypothetical protein JHK85_045815 [Glycine max]
MSKCEPLHHKTLIIRREVHSLWQVLACVFGLRLRICYAYDSEVSERASELPQPFTHSTVAVLLAPGPEPLTYLDDFPRPDPNHDETILVIPRAASGKNISAKERRAGQLRSIVFEQEDGQHGGKKCLIYPPSFVAKLVAREDDVRECATTVHADIGSS